MRVHSFPWYMAWSADSIHEEEAWWVMTHMPFFNQRHYRIDWWLRWLFLMAINHLFHEDRGTVRSRLVSLRATREGLRLQYPGWF